LIRDRLRTLFEPADPLRRESAALAAGAKAAPGGAAAVNAQPQVRHSRGLDQFFQALSGREGLSILDLGEVNQSNVGYITSLGHRLYSEDFLHTLDSVFGGGDPDATQANPAKAREFLDQSLQFPSHHFDAALVWDTFQYLAKPLLTPVMERLLESMQPQGVILALFHAEAREAAVPAFAFRIVDSNTLQLAPKGSRRLAQCFNNRSIERLFEPCQSLKFFLTRESLREVIVKR
jgi:hypothetical protein